MKPSRQHNSVWRNVNKGGIVNQMPRFNTVRYINTGRCQVFLEFT